MKPVKQPHDDWCRKFPRCNCSFQLANEMHDDWEAWLEDNRREMIDMETGLRHSVVIL